MEKPVETLSEVCLAAASLCACCSAYRTAHDVHGDGSREAGYAWDQMRKAEKRTLEALAKIDAIGKGEG